jgi:glycosyltransferase involved in cell wall biosynthesis
MTAISMTRIATEVVALMWLGAGVYLGLGWLRFEGLLRASDESGVAGGPVPSVSLVIAARNEADSIGDTLDRISRVEYPELEIVVVNDRSEDGTGPIAAKHTHTLAGLKAVNVRTLPEEWLGKTHALHEGYKQSSGEWLCFIDADVALEPDCLRRALAVARMRRLDHLCLFPALRTHGLLESAFVMTFGFYFGAYMQPWKAKDSRSNKFCGVGAFNLIRRDAYEAIGGHERLRMEVADDIKLGKLVKQHRFRQDAMDSDGLVHLRWQKSGVGAYLRGIEKNAFAGMDYSLSRVALGSLGILMMSISPFVALAVDDFATRTAGTVALTIIALAYGPLGRAVNKSRLYFVSHPLGAVILLSGLWISTVKTLWRGAVVWRGTAYPLRLLKKYLV